MIHPTLFKKRLYELLKFNIQCCYTQRKKKSNIRNSNDVTPYSCEKLAFYGLIVIQVTNDSTRCFNGLVSSDVTPYSCENEHSTGGMLFIDVTTSSREKNSSIQNAFLIYKKKEEIDPFLNIID